MKFINIFILALFTLVANAQTDVSPYVPGVTVEGITYFLPRTVLRVTVIAEKTVTTPGSLNKYAFRYLRLADVPHEETTSWTIKSVSLDPYGTPDRTKGYSILLKGRTLAPLATLTRDGILLSVNAQTEEETLPSVPSGTEPIALADPRQYMSQEILAAGTMAKMAELTATRIYDLRESRDDLIQGEASNTPKDGAQLQLMLSQLNEQCTALESLFRGTKQVSTHVFTFTYDPTAETDRDVLFRFSPTTGLASATDRTASPVYISVQPVNPLPVVSEQPEVTKKKAKLDKGLRYNVPQREAFRVFDTFQTYTALELPIAQFGTVEILGEALFDKKTTTQVYLHPSTGSLLRLEQ